MKQLIVLLILFSGLGFLHAGAPAHRLATSQYVPELISAKPATSVDGAQAHETLHRRELRHQRRLERKAKWQSRFRDDNLTSAKKQFRAFILFSLLGTGLYVLATMIGAGAILTTVLTTAVLAEYVSAGLLIGAGVAYLYALITGISAMVNFIIGVSGI